MEPSEIYLTLVLGACIGWFAGKHVVETLKWVSMRGLALVMARRPPDDRR